MLTEEPWLDPERLMILTPSGREWRNCVESAIGHWRGRTLDRPTTGPELAGRITKNERRLPADGVAVVTLVTVQDFRGDQPVEQFICSDAIGHMAASQQKGNRTTAYVGQRVDFCRPPAA